MESLTTRSAAVMVAMFAALLSAVCPAEAAVGVGFGAQVFSVFNERGEHIAYLAMATEYKRTYAMNLASGAFVAPVEQDGTIRLKMSLVVADQAVNRNAQSWGVELQLLDREGWKVVQLDPNGTSAETTLSTDRKPGMYPIQARYRFRAGREYSGFRFLGIKVTLDAKAGNGNGVAAFWLHIVEPPASLCLTDKDAVWNWAQLIRRQMVNGTDQAAVGGLYPLFTPTEVVPMAPVSAPPVETRRQVPIVVQPRQDVPAQPRTEAPVTVPQAPVCSGRDPRYDQLVERVNKALADLASQDAKIDSARRADFRKLRDELVALRTEARMTTGDLNARADQADADAETLRLRLMAHEVQIADLEATVKQLTKAFERPQPPVVVVPSCIDYIVVFVRSKRTSCWEVDCVDEVREEKVAKVIYLKYRDDAGRLVENKSLPAARQGQLHWRSETVGSTRTLQVSLCQDGSWQERKYDVTATTKVVVVPVQ